MCIARADSGHSAIKVPDEVACGDLYRSGVAHNTERHGVAIALSEAAETAILTWVPILFRLASAQLQGESHTLIVAGDWNARLGPVDMAARHILDKVHRRTVSSTHFQ